MILIGRYLSPFVRRVGVTLKLYGIPFEHHAIPSTDEAVRAANPISRVPALELDDGETLIDSAVILDHLDHLAGPEKALTPASGASRRKVMTLTGIATGAVEKAVLTVYEVRFRPEEARHQPWVDRCGDQARAGFEYLDGRIEGPWFTGEQMTQADVSVAAYWEFVKIANPALAGTIACPGIEALTARAMELPAFKETLPETS